MSGKSKPAFPFNLVNGLFHFLILFTLSLILITALSAREKSEDISGSHHTDVKMEEMVVVGNQPGPPMWQVSKGDHELWIFGTLSPLPSRMIWESHKVEDVIARSQEYLAMGGVKLGMTPNPLKIKSRANSWALGYVDDLRQFDYPDTPGDCSKPY